MSIQLHYTFHKMRRKCLQDGSFLTQFPFHPLHRYSKHHKSIIKINIFCFSSRFLSFCFPYTPTHNLVLILNMPPYGTIQQDIVEEICYKKVSFAQFMTTFRTFVSSWELKLYCFTMKNSIAQN